MNALIFLADPQPASQRVANDDSSNRVNYFAGRSLTAADFARQQRYLERRFGELAPRAPGVLTGLELSPAYFAAGGASPLTKITIAPGAATTGDGRMLRLDAPMDVNWPDLVAAMIAADPASKPPADGVYFLILRIASMGGVEGPAPDPCLSPSADPLLDMRQDSFVEAWLSTRLGDATAFGVGTANAIALALNTFLGTLTRQTAVDAIGAGAAIGLIVILGGAPTLLSQSAGRLASGPNDLSAALMAQTRESFAQALGGDLVSEIPAEKQVASRARFRFLPSGCELPLGLLLNRNAAAAPFDCPLFSSQGQATIYLQFIRSSQAQRFSQRALAAPPYDFSTAQAESVTLALAIPDAAYTPDLIDVPRADPVLVADVYLAYARAAAAQRATTDAWTGLYGGLTSGFDASPRGQLVSFLLNPTTAAQAIFTLPNSADANTVAWGALGQLADAADILLANLSNGDFIDLLTTSASLKGRTGSQAATAGLAAQGYVFPPQGATALPQPGDNSVFGEILPPQDASALPAGSDYQSWQSAVATAASPGSPNAALLQPFIDAGVVNPSDAPAIQQAAIDAIVNMGDDEAAATGALLSLAFAQLFFATFWRVARSLETWLAAHDRLLVLQRQHLDVISAHLSALAGGVPTDGSGLSAAKLLPFYQLGASTEAVESVTPSAQAQTVESLAITPTSPSVAARTTDIIAPSMIITNRTSPIVNEISVAPAFVTPPKISSARFQPTIDAAQEVATQRMALQVSAPITAQTVQYGVAKHVSVGPQIADVMDTGVTALEAKMASLGLPANPLRVPLAPAAGKSPPAEVDYYNYAMSGARDLLNEIAAVEANALRFETLYLRCRDQISSLETAIGALSAAVATAREDYRETAAQSAKLAGDYAAAQRLAQEEVQRLLAARASRQAAIASATGLFMAHEPTAPLTLAPPPSQALIASTPTDIAPGCAADHQGPPTAVQNFLELLLETPLSDWAALSGAWSDLPNLSGLRRLYTMRAARLSSWTPSTDFGVGAAAGDLALLASSGRAAFDPLFRASLVFDSSLAVTQLAAFSIFAPPDIIMLPSVVLRARAEELRRRVEAAAGCVYETLKTLPASNRADLANRARAGSLPALDFALWPLPQNSADYATATTTRRLSDLVGWLSSQLVANARPASRAALSNLILALVIASAYGDPNDDISGQVTNLGGVAPRPGIPIRVTFNVPPRLGSTLDLVDSARRVVGVVRVDDHDAFGATATVLSYSEFGSDPTAGFSVVAQRGGAARLLS